MISDAHAERIAVALEQLADEAHTANLLKAGNTATVPEPEQVANRDEGLERLAADRSEPRTPTPDTAT